MFRDLFLVHSGLFRTLRFWLFRFTPEYSGPEYYPLLGTRRSGGDRQHTGRRWGERRGVCAADVAQKRGRAVCLAEGPRKAALNQRFWYDLSRSPL